MIAGVTYVDTARTYRDGEDEKVIGAAIKGQRDDNLVLATKTQVSAMQMVPGQILKHHYGLLMSITLMSTNFII